MQVAIQGERGSFSHQAAQVFVGDNLELRCCAFSAEVFRLLTQGKVDAAVIPIENSLAGSVLEHYDLLLAQPVRIEAERLVRIRHQLIAAPGTELDAIREVYSHPVALAQCRNFFAAHPQVHAMPFYDTAGSVAHAVGAGAPTAGIASVLAAEQYAGVVLAADIEDNPENYTRFLLLRQAGDEPDHAAARNLEPGRIDKVSLAFSVPNRPGSLVEALQIFARHALNLTRLESRPVPGSPWEYVFYADYQLQNPHAADAAMQALTRSCRFVKELGRYPAAMAVTSGS